MKGNILLRFLQLYDFNPFCQGNRFFGPSNNVIMKLFKQREKECFCAVDMFVNMIYYRYYFMSSQMHSISSKVILISRNGHF